MCKGARVPSFIGSRRGREGGELEGTKELLSHRERDLETFRKLSEELSGDFEKAKEQHAKTGVRANARAKAKEKVKVKLRIGTLLRESDQG